MHILPTTLSLITTHQCTAACDHCCFSCGPKVKDFLPLDLARKAIAGAKEFGTFKVVVFSGGECFLLKKNLDELVAYSNSLGFRTRCVTNAYWATSVKGATSRLTALVEAGLNEINFSTGPFHQKYVPLSRIINACKASTALGLTTVVTVEETEDQPASVREFYESEDFKEALTSGKMMVRRSTWIKADGAMPISHSESLDRFGDDRISGCSTSLRVIAISPKADVYACCGLHMERIPELNLGSLLSNDLSSLLTTHPDDLLKILIHVDGPERAYQLAKKFDSSISLPKGCVHPCETCRLLHTDSDVIRALASNAQQFSSEVSLRYMVALAKTTFTTSAML